MTDHNMTDCHLSFAPRVPGLIRHLIAFGRDGFGRNEFGRDEYAGEAPDQVRGAVQEIKIGGRK